MAKILLQCVVYVSSWTIYFDLKNFFYAPCSTDFL